MKKTLVALAVAAVAATSANAAVVYNQDGTKVEVGGSVRVLLNKSTDKRIDLLNDVSRLEVKASHDLGEGLAALAYGRLDLGDSNYDGVKLRKLYAGFSLDGVGALTFGRQQTNADDLGFAGYSEKVDGGFNNFVLDEATKVVRFTSADFDGLVVGVDYVFANDASKYNAQREKNPNTRAYVLTAFYSKEINDDFGFGLKAGYGHQKLTAQNTLGDILGGALAGPLKDATVANVYRINSNETFSKKAFTLNSELRFAKKFSVGLDYSQAKVEDVKARGLLVGFKYQITDMTSAYILGGVGKVKEDGETAAKIRNLGLGVSYKLHKNVQTFAEYGRTVLKDGDGDTVSKNNSFNLGLRVFF